MAKVLIVSDSHGRTENLKGIISVEKPFDLMIHCGDVELSDDYRELVAMADTPVYAVAGNCDVFSSLEHQVDFDFQGHHILVVHGYYEGVNNGLDGLYRKAKLLGADVALFGHTHMPFYREEDGIVFANPGSTDKPRQAGGEKTYMVMDIEPGKKIAIERKKYSI